MALRLLLVGMVASLGLDVPTGWRVESWECAGRTWLDSRQTELQDFTETRPLMVDAHVLEPPASDRPMMAETNDEAANKVALKASVIEVIEEPELVIVPEPPAPPAAAVPVVAERAVEPAMARAELADAAFAAVVNQMVAGFAAPAAEPSRSILLAERALELPQNVFASAAAELAGPTLAESEQPALASNGVEPVPPAPAPPAPDAAEWIGAVVDASPDAAPVQDRVIAPKSASRNERLITAVRLTRQALSAWAGVMEQDADVVAVQH